MEDKNKKIIIERPEALSELRKKTEWSITAFGWMLWIFLCRPLMILCLWYMGVRFFFRQMVELGGWEALVDFMGGYLFVILLIAFALMGWNIYNVLRFRKKERRLSAPPTSGEEIGRFFGISAEEVKALREGKETSIDFLPKHQLRFRTVTTRGGSMFDGKFKPAPVPPPEEKKK